MSLRSAAYSALVALFALIFGSSQAQQYPVRPIRILTTESGGGADFVSRLISQGVGDALGKPLIVDNRAGTLSIEAVGKSPPDGYTLLVYGSTVWLLPFMRDNVPWNPSADFAPVILAIRAPNVIVVHPALAVNSLSDLIAYAKAKPGELNYASSGAGTPSHLAGELFKSLAGLSIVHVPYRGGGPAINAVMGGQVQLSFGTAGAVTPHVKSGRLKALAVTSAEPSKLFPGLPTAASSGVPGYESGTLQGVFAPAGTPSSIVMRLNSAISRALERNDIKEKFYVAGLETVGGSPEQFASIIKSDMSKMGKVIKDAGIHAD